MTTDAYVARQLALEETMFRSSAEKLRADIEKAKKGDREDETAYSSRLMTAKIEAVATGLRAVFADYEGSARPGRPPAAFKYLQFLEPEVSAALALKGVLAGITKRRTMQRCAVQIGRMIEDEILWRTFEAQAPEESAITERKLAKVSSYRHRKRVVSVMAGRAEISKGGMTETERLQVGVQLLEVVEAHANLIERQSAGDGSAASKRMIYIVPKVETLDWIERFTTWYAAVSPEFWPTVIPPRPWSGPHTGGYYSRMPRPIPLVKNARKGYLEEMENIDMPKVYEAINAVQETAFKVDEWTLGVMEQVWGLGLDVAGLPKRDPKELPAKPADIAESEDARNEWKKKAALVYADNVRSLSRRMQFDQGVKMARQFSPEAAIYFPHQFDFRGRMYAIPLLSYQGPDWMRGLLRFSAGKAVDNADAMSSLMMQGAVLWGADKGTLNSRLEWASEHSEQISLAGTDPMASYWWADADQPWQFLQWCHEWTEFRARGYGYVSSFICSADGTCNGLQHFSAMLRDPLGGAATNLVPATTPADIYAQVAEVVTAKLCLISANSGMVPRAVAPHSGARWADLWRSFGVNRKTTKRAVMVLPYGGTQYSTREFVEEAIRERLRETGEESPFKCRIKGGDGSYSESDGVFQASLFLAPIVWEAIGEVVVAAREAMGWLKQVAKLVAGGGQPVTWATADGFPVQQAYYETKAKRVDLLMSGTVIKLIIREELPTIDKRRQEQGVSPNFVHSCDGTALRKYVVCGKENGINSFAVVHDSFGCVAADFETMQACLRAAFVDLYESRDVLEDLRLNVEPSLADDKRAEIPAVPQQGTLDIQQVKASAFFFA